jgi:hypothetical protein
MGRDEKRDNHLSLKLIPPLFSVALDTLKSTLNQFELLKASGSH